MANLGSVESSAKGCGVRKVVGGLDLPGLQRPIAPWPGGDSFFTCIRTTPPPQCSITGTPSTMDMKTTMVTARTGTTLRTITDTAIHTDL